MHGFAGPGATRAALGMALCQAASAHWADAADHPDRAGLGAIALPPDVLWRLIAAATQATVASGDSTVAVVPGEASQNH